MRNEKYKKTIAVDFDGTLAFGKWPECGEPNMRLINFIRKHRNDYTWILWTNREGEHLEAAIKYMQSFGITFDYVNANSYQVKSHFGNDSRKIYANYYIDDKNCTLGRLIREALKERWLGWLSQIRTS